MIKIVNNQLYHGLESDTKPTSTVTLGAKFVEIDTGNVFEYKFNGVSNDWIVETGGSGADLSLSIIGSDGTSGLLDIKSTDKGDVTIHNINDILAKLAPTKPENIDIKTPICTNTTFQALAVTTGVDELCTTEKQPTIEITDVYDPESGELIGYIDTINSGQITLTENDDSGNDSWLTITDNSDFYAGIDGKSGIWNKFDVNITPLIDLSIAEHLFKFAIDTTESNELSLHIAESPNPVINSLTLIPGTGDIRISGVSSLVDGQDINISNFSVGDAIKTHYNANYIASITSDDVDIWNSGVEITPPAENDTIIYSLTTNIKADNYTETLDLVARAYGASGNVVAKAYKYNYRIDTISNESNRLRAGNGQFPSSGYGSVYDSTISLDVVGYDEELQLVNGKYQQPVDDYSANLILSPNYSILPSVARQCIPIDVIVLNGASGFVVEFNDTENFVGVETVGIEIYAKVEGLTGWIDCNKAYDLVNAPVNDGDAAMDFARSTETSKRVTFGSIVRSGNLYLRVRLPSGSNIKFGQDIVITPY